MAVGLLMIALPRHREVRMAKLVEAFIMNGKISYNNGIPAKERTEEYRDGVTYITEATKRVAPSFDVDFSVQSEFEMPGGAICRPFISIGVPVAVDSKKAYFADIEDAGADQIAPMLRAIADAIEQQLKEVREDRERRGNSSPATEQ